MAQGVGVGGVGCENYLKVKSQMFNTTRGPQMHTAAAATRLSAVSSRAYRLTDRGRDTPLVPTPARLQGTYDAATRTGRDRVVEVRALRCLPSAGLQGVAMRRGARRVTHIRQVQDLRAASDEASDEDIESIAAWSEGLPTGDTLGDDETELDLVTLMKTVAALEKRQQKVNVQTQEILQ
eukprot:144274-Pyramimonas_sp.AAC.1